MPARRVPDQNDGCGESPGIQAYRLNTACGRLEVYSRGRFRRYTEGFRGSLDSLPSIGGLVLCVRPDQIRFLDELKLSDSLVPGVSTA